MRSLEERQPGRPAAGEWALWLLLAAVSVHIVEEQALNFRGWTLRYLHAAITVEDFHQVNASILIYGVACAMIGWRAPAIALSYAALLIVNALFHAGGSLITGAYSPGTITAVILFLPSGLAAYRAAVHDGVLTRRTLLTSVALALLWHAFLGTVYGIKLFAPMYP